MSDMRPGSSGVAGSEPPRTLTEVEVAMLALESRWWKYAGAKETAVHDQFDMSMTRYYQVLDALIDKPAALAADPATVGRLRRLRGARQRARASGHADRHGPAD